MAHQVCRPFSISAFVKLDLPLGNGKTISIKAIMKSCLEKGHVALYVKSFTSTSELSLVPT